MLLVEIKVIFGRDLKRIHHQRHLILIRFRRYCFVVLCIADGMNPSLLRPFPRMSSDFSLFSYKLSIREKGYHFYLERESVMYCQMQYCMTLVLCDLQMI